MKTFQIISQQKWKKLVWKKQSHNFKDTVNSEWCVRPVVKWNSFWVILMWLFDRYSQNVAGRITDERLWPEGDDMNHAQHTMRIKWALQKGWLEIWTHCGAGIAVHLCAIFLQITQITWDKAFGCCKLWGLLKEIIYTLFRAYVKVNLCKWGLK